MEKNEKNERAREDLPPDDRGEPSKFNNKKADALSPPRGERRQPSSVNPPIARDAPSAASNPLNTRPSNVNSGIRDASSASSNPSVNILSNFRQMQNVLLNNSKDDSDDEIDYLSGNLPMADTKVSFGAIGDLWDTHTRTRNDVIRHTYYEKDVTSSLMFHAKGAHTWRSKLVTLGEEVRRL